RPAHDHHGDQEKSHRNRRTDLKLSDDPIPDFVDLIVWMRSDNERFRLAMYRNWNIHRGHFRVNESDEPCWHRRWVAIVTGIISRGLFSRCRAGLARNADVAKLVEVRDDPA